MATYEENGCFESSRDPDDPEWLRQIDHTADAGILVRARSVDQLFARAAWGLFSTIADMTTVRPEKRDRVAVDGPDREALLVRWLSELNFRHATEGWIFCRFDVSVCSSQRVTAIVHGERFDPERHVIHTEIKAVTFHGLRIWRQGAELWARVIFDV